MAALDQAGGHLKGGEQGGGAMALVVVAEPGQRFAVGQLQPALGPLQRLDVGLFVDRQHHCILRRLQVEPDHVGRLLGKAGIGADAPAAPPRQGDLVLAQHAPDLMLGDIAQMPRQQDPVPAAVTRRRRLVQRRQDALFVLGRVVGGFAAARRIRQPRQTGAGNAAAPFADRSRAHSDLHRHRGVAEPLGHSQDHRGPQRQAPLGLPRRQPRPQRCTILAGQPHFRRFHRGRLSYPLTYATRY